MSILGLIAGGLGGVGQAMGEQASKGIEEQHKVDLAQQMSQIQLDQQKALEDYQVQLQTQQRTAQAQRGQTALSGIVNGALAQKYDPSKLPPEFDQTDGSSDMVARQKQMDADRQSLMNNRDLMVQAYINSGDVDPKTLATVTQKSDANQNWLLAKQGHDDVIAGIAAGHDDARMMVGAMMAEARANRNSDQFLQILHLGSQMTQQAEEARKQIEGAQKQMLISTDPNEKKQLQDRIGVLQARSQRLEATSDQITQAAMGHFGVGGAQGVPASGAPAAAPVAKGWTVAVVSPPPKAAPAAAPAPAAPAPAPAAPAAAPAPAAPAVANPALSKLSSVELSGIASSPRYSPAAKAAATQEILRRKNAPVQMDDSTNPDLYR